MDGRPSVRLRAAADQLRRLADGATQGDWLLSREFIYVAVEGGTIGVAQYSPTDRIGQLASGNARLMASQGPSFARAVVAWLEAEAESSAAYEMHLADIGMAWDHGVDEPHHWTVSLARALAVAAAVGVPADQERNEQ